MRNLIGLRVAPLVCLLSLLACGGCRTGGLQAEYLCASRYEPEGYSTLSTEASAPALAPAPQTPTPAPPAPAPVVQWPGNEDGLVFAWRQGLDAQLKKWGKAAIEADGTMQLSEGAFVVEGVSDALLEACKKTSELTIEADLTVHNVKQIGPKRIVTFSKDFVSRNFTLGQQGEDLVLRLRTPQTDANGTNPEVKLFRLQAGEPVHVLVSYRAGRLVCYRNGEQVLDTDRVKGDFSNWEPQHLVLGNEWSRQRDWSGSLRRVAIYSRFVENAEAQEHYRLAKKAM